MSEVRTLSDRVVEHLRGVAEWPDFEGSRYELLERVGRGGMGTVFLARDRDLDRDVAIKVMSQPDPDAEELARMHREARILARLEHPGIVPVHDAGQLADTRPFYVMKYVRGRRLDEHAADTASLLERLRLFLQICDAVSFAHAHGVIHRDLKPENVMIGPFGEVLVLDWGVAKVRGAPPEDAGQREPSGQPAHEEIVTERGTVLGTRGYMAPEQEAGAVDLVDRWSDVYALGALLRFLLRDATGPSIRPLQAIATMAMATRPEDRYASVEALAADVRGAIDGDPVRAYRETILERTARVARKHRTPLMLIGAYLLVRAVLLLAAR